MPGWLTNQPYFIPLPHRSRTEAGSFQCKFSSNFRKGNPSRVGCSLPREVEKECVFKCSGQIVYTFPLQSKGAEGGMSLLKEEQLMRTGGHACQAPARYCNSRKWQNLRNG